MIVIIHCACTWFGLYFGVTVMIVSPSVNNVTTPFLSTLATGSEILEFTFLAVQTSSFSVAFAGSYNAFRNTKPDASVVVYSVPLSMRRLVIGAVTVITQVAYALLSILKAVITALPTLFKAVTSAEILPSLAETFNIDVSEDIHSIFAFGASILVCNVTLPPTSIDA